jgi:DNA-binding response OmpR family regulator
VSISLGTGELLQTSAQPQAARPRLRAAELKVLRYLALQAERYVSAAELQESVLRTSGNGTAVRFHIKELRRKLGKTLIESRRGYGYRVREDLT